MVHHNVRRVSARFKKGKYSAEQRPRSFAIYRGQNDQSGMNLDAVNQATKVARIFGDYHPILRNTPLEDAMVGRATPANVQRMDRIVEAGRVEPGCELWRQAFVDEQLHAASAQGRPPGRPMSGCVRA